MKYKYNQGDKVKIPESGEIGEVINKGWTWIKLVEGKFIFGKYYTVNTSHYKNFKHLGCKTEEWVSSNRDYSEKDLDKKIKIKYKEEDLVSMQGIPYPGKIVSLPSWPKRYYTVLLLDTSSLGSKKKPLGIRNIKVLGKRLEKIASIEDFQTQ